MRGPQIGDVMQVRTVQGVWVKRCTIESKGDLEDAVKHCQEGDYRIIKPPVVVWPKEVET